jgi:hypothetical protein
MHTILALFVTNVFSGMEHIWGKKQGTMGKRLAICRFSDSNTPFLSKRKAVSLAAIRQVDNRGKK